jgi:hypothetical protein
MLKKPTFSVIIEGTFGSGEKLLRMGEAVPIYFSIVAFICTLGAIALAVMHIYRHLLNYTEPTYQRFIVRIIFMVPVSAALTFTCFRSRHCYYRNEFICC